MNNIISREQEKDVGNTCFRSGTSEGGIWMMKIGAQGVSGLANCTLIQTLGLYDNLEIAC